MDAILALLKIPAQHLEREVDFSKHK